MSEELFYIFNFSLIGDKGVGKTTLANKFCEIKIKGDLEPTKALQKLSKSFWLKERNNVCIKYMINDNTNFIDQRNNTAISINDAVVFFFVFDLSN